MLYKNIRRAAVTLLAAAVVLGTILALILPALTLEEPACGLEEHPHGDVCYGAAEILACKAQVHTHGEACRDADGKLLCGYEDFLLHSHEAGCYDEKGELRCLLAEITEHAHGDGCFSSPETVSTEPTGETTGEPILPEPVFTCTQQEVVLHIHGEDCFQDGVWICGSPQVELHSHSEDCFATEAVLTCQLTEHTHTEECYPVPQTTTAPTETAAEATTEATTEATMLPTEAEILLAAEEPEYTAEAREDDKAAVVGDGIRFRLFNYSLNINKTASLNEWRPISAYFTFRNSRLDSGEPTTENVYIPTKNLNASHDADGFPATHATVERVLNGGLPVLDLTRNANGTARTDPGISADTRSLAYLFSDTGDHAVTAYSPGNTILQKNGNHYWYDSRTNAVDYDTAAGLFRVRDYVERNSTTAGHGSGYGDFLPFNYTGGVSIHDPEKEATPYHLKTENADYWFGMTMEVSFYQTKGGLLGDGNMVFRFSGDDDVWVFVDDVLVLDLGGTHGTVDGSIDFATGEVLQYLSWNGANVTEAERTKGSDTSFPTTIRACFDAAGKTPNGGWSGDGKTFADYTEHTLKFFYLERGAAVANCKIDFSLPTLPDKSLTVTKELTANDEVGDYIRDSLSYRFRVVKADGTGELFLTPGMTYELMEKGTKVGNGTVDGNGTFALKAGQSAQFADMLVKGGGAKSYVVQEIMPDGLTGQYAGVEYTVSGAGGLTETEEGPTEDFTAFETAVLSAEQTQVVTYRNKVDVSRLSRLKVSKLTAEGSKFTGEESFPIQVKLGGQPLSVGTEYRIGDTVYAVTAPGILELKAGQTAEILQGILSGTAYEITELEQEGLHYRASYSGTVSPDGTVTCTPNGASGEFPLGSTVHITVTNASYDFAVEIPITKEAVHNQTGNTFSFRVQAVRQNESGAWIPEEELPGTKITVTDSAVTRGRILIGFAAGTGGSFYYRVSEETGNGSFLYDDTFYILEITAGDGTAEVTGIWKNGVEEQSADSALAFVNLRAIGLTVAKTVVGGSPAEQFSFTAEVTLDGQPVPMESGTDYTAEGNVVRFALSHGQAVTISGIPWGARVVVTEESREGYIPSYQIGNAQAAQGNGAEVTADREYISLRFENRCAYELPQTGGSGTNLYTLGGLLQMAAAACLLYYQKKRDMKIN